MNRRNLIKNSLMAIAVSLLPKVLRPMDGEVEDEDIRQYPLSINECYLGEPPEWAKHYAMVQTEPLIVGFMIFNENGFADVVRLDNPIPLEVL